MRTTRRSLALALAAAAVLSAAACSSAMDGIPSASPATSSATSAETPAAEPSDEPVQDSSTDDDSEDVVEDGELPEPGAGVPGDAGLCEAVLGWYAIGGLALLGADEQGQVDPDEFLPVLEALQDAPADHQDADGALLDAADAVTTAAADAADALGSGTDALTAYDLLGDPSAAFADACTAAGAV